MQKKTLRLIAKFLMKEGFFRGGGRRDAKRFGELCVPLKKSWVPLYSLRIIQEYVRPTIGRKIRIFSQGQKTILL